jgi:hypothetical protein
VIAGQDTQREVIKLESSLQGKKEAPGRAEEGDEETDEGKEGGWMWVMLEGGW